MSQVQSKNRATSDPEARKTVLASIKKQGIEDVLLWFTDLEGHLKSFSITTSEVEGALDDGMGFDGSSITGFNAIEESDMVAIPDPDTFRILPDGRAARMICDVVTPDGNPYDGDPRHVLRLALERMSAMGFDTFNVGPEAEYFLFKDEHGTETLDEGGYFAQTTMDAATGIRRDTIRALEQMGIPVEYHHHEVGPSQHEIDIRFAGALDMADYMLTYRLVVKEVAKQHGYHATFMPKPLFGENGSGMHTHQSLFTGGRNAFFDGDDKWHLSDVGKAFIAGQLRHAREIAAVFAQWVNSYKRLVPGFEAPVNLAYSRRNRSAACRIPMYSASPKAKRVEFRPPDPSCNPYLAFGSMLMAGLDGVENKIDPGEPLDKDIYDLGPEEMKKVPSLPGSLEESLRALEKDHDFLIKGDVFSEELIETWIDYKMKNEVQAVNTRPHPYEFNLYYDI